MTQPATAIDGRWVRVRAFDRGREDCPPLDVCPSCWAIQSALFTEGTVREGRYRIVKITITRFVPTPDHECHYCGSVSVLEVAS